MITFLEAKRSGLQGVKAAMSAFLRFIFAEWRLYRPRIRRLQWAHFINLRTLSCR